MISKNLEGHYRGLLRYCPSIHLERLGVIIKIYHRKREKIL
jgi:hypothetical protein